MAEARDWIDERIRRTLMSFGEQCFTVCELVDRFMETLSPEELEELKRWPPTVAIKLKRARLN